MSDALVENALQLGGIRTATLDDPQPLGGPGCRVALVDTGSGLRFTVALDRGGDIVDAAYNDCPLAFLTPNGLKRPSEAYHDGMDWLRSWAGGLLTTCGPLHIGAPVEGDPHARGLHGHHANTPAAVLSVRNHDPRRDQREMSLELRIRDSRMFGPTVEVRRQIQCTLGEPTIKLSDEVTNLGDEVVPHHWLYHINAGYPLLEPDARLKIPGEELLRFGDLADDPTLDWRQVPGPLDGHRGAGQGVVILKAWAGDQGLAEVRLENPRRKLALVVRFAVEQLPLIAHWRHYGPRGSYVCGIEPFNGLLLEGQPPQEHWRLEPGESRRYSVQLEVATTGG
jgi:hypothetical protein